MRLLCATLFLGVFSTGCALTHERGDDAGAPDALQRDAFVGTITNCTDYWTSLPACPAVPSEAIGTPCREEGARCGFVCCEPGPAIACREGIWVAGDAPDCRGVRCSPALGCGRGSCAAGRVCLHPSTEVLLPDQCVVPTTPVNACSAAPAGSLVGDGCMQCQCSDGAGIAEITLDCACCDTTHR